MEEETLEGGAIPAGQSPSSQKLEPHLLVPVVESLAFHVAVNVSLSDEKITSVLAQLIYHGPKDNGNAAAIQDGEYIAFFGLWRPEADEFVVICATSSLGGGAKSISFEKAPIPSHGAYTTQVVVDYALFTILHIVT